MMSLHKLTAGSGYDYLTRQVAAMDSTEKGYTGLASYYTERGETPGVWVGTGCESIQPGFAASVVAAEQMQALFGAGMSPIGPELVLALGEDASSTDVAAAVRLGSPFRLSAEASVFRIEVARQLAALNRSMGRPATAAVSVDERAAIRTIVARDMFAVEFGRAPLDARELAGFVARKSRPAATTVAGFDLTFSPPKSVSTLWAVANRGIAARIEAAHREAVMIALGFVEKSLLFTREGTHGARQVDVTGLVGAAFTHRDTRAGDPDLHTHVAVANKVKAVESGKWLAIDGRVLYQGIVVASETYNTALVKLLEAQGLAFVDRYTGVRDRGRPVREISGVAAVLNERWSTRRAEIEAYRQELVAGFQRDHGRPPTVVEAVKLAQQATLATRDPKHEPRTVLDQRIDWHRQALEVLGGEKSLRRMMAAVLAPSHRTWERADAAWFERAADRIIEAAQARGATWQDVHLRAEAQRQVRRSDLRIDQIQPAVDWLVGMAKDRSVSLARPDHGLTDPPALRRRDGASVYTVSGAEQFTSRAVLDAEKRLVDLAGATGARFAASASVAKAIARSAAEGRGLTSGQSFLVTQMATSGARLQLAIAPAGAGKTTAMQALTSAWMIDGGNVIGLAPSAAAAAQLGAQTGNVTDTMAKLVWGIEHQNLPRWAARVGTRTLVIIDEAGMADTISLHTVCAWLADRGAAIRLIGDDQQLAAIGAGGVLRDIKTTHGAISLTELLRFADPAEAAASLALRDGDPAALGFYLDAGRVHVGDLTEMTDEAFSAWRTDRNQGKDAVLLAPTVALVGELNARARSDRLATSGKDPGWEAVLADGNKASAGDVVITRTNNRSLRWSRTNWVKNGDRWTVRQVSPAGDLRVEHRPTGRLITLPHGYVSESVELGYACTIHAAQGVSCDTTHTVATPELTRQQLYTMATRGRISNHIWLEVVGDGADDSLIRPEAITPPTPTEILEHILNRDASQTSATSLLAQQTDPRLLLGDATRIYSDALVAAAEHHLGRKMVASIDDQVQRLLPGIGDEPAWPTLHAHLVLLAANNQDPIALLTQTLDTRDLAGAHDEAAVVAWRLDPTTATSSGPLHWLPPVPPTLLEDPEFGPWLTRRGALVTELAAEVADQVRSETSAPAWVTPGIRPPDTATIVDVEVWRAAMGVDATDRRPTGPRQIARAAFEHQHQLLARVCGGQAPALAEWRDTLEALAPAMAHDPFTANLAEHVAALSRASIDTGSLLDTGVAEGPLPDDHAASALWWRITRLLTREALTAADQRSTPGAWIEQLPQLVSAEDAHELQQSPFWSTLTGLVDIGLQRGLPLDTLLRPTTGTPDMDRCLSLICQIATLTSQPPNEHDAPLEDLPPADLDIGRPIPDDNLPIEAPEPTVEQKLAIAALLRQQLGRPEQNEEDLRRMFARADAWRDSPVSRDRLIHINQLTQDYFASHLPGSWAHDYLGRRFRTDLTSNPLLHPGYAPESWTGLVRNLRSQGISDQEMTQAGVATHARRTGGLIDLFRNRVTFPITDSDGVILGFVARRHPDADDNTGCPKYLNTRETPLFHKSDQFYGTLQPDTIPVIVEGPMDAIAVTLAGNGRYTGLAPLGTALTDTQAGLLYGQARVIIATDADQAGRTAACRDYWQLTPWGIDPQLAHLPGGTDPASVLTTFGSDSLQVILDNATPAADQMINTLIDDLPPGQALAPAAQILAARPPQTWQTTTVELSRAINVHPEIIRAVLTERVVAWNADPRRAATSFGRDDAELRRRLCEADVATRSTTIGGFSDSTSAAHPDLAETGQDPAVDLRRSPRPSPRR